ncbi:hypothetical protein Tco_1339387 [Tanacetum coccineum]
MYPSSVPLNSYPYYTQPINLLLNAPIYPNYGPTGLFADSTGYVTPIVHWIKDYPLPNGLKMHSQVGSYDGKEDLDNYLHLFEGAIHMHKWAMLLSCHMFTYTLKDFARIWWNSKTTAKEFTTNRVRSDHKEGFDRLNKSFSWDNNKGKKKNWDRFSPDKGSNHRLLANLSKSPREILAIEKVAKTFEQPSCMIKRRRSHDMSKYCHFYEDHGHETNQCRELRNQIKEAVRSGLLAHLVKGIKKGKAKTSKTQHEEGKKGDKDIVPVEAPILIISRESQASNRKSTKDPVNETGEITFPLLLVLKTPLIQRAFLSSQRGSFGSHSRRKSLRIIVSTIHAAIKFHTPHGIGNVFSTFKPNKVKEG